MSAIHGSRGGYRRTDPSDPALRELDVLTTGMMNERFEITVLDRLLLLAADLALPDGITTELAANRQEAKAALTEMKAIVERRRSES